MTLPADIPLLSAASGVLVLCLITLILLMLNTGRNRIVGFILLTSCLILVAFLTLEPSLSNLPEPKTRLPEGENTSDTRAQEASQSSVEELKNEKRDSFLELSASWQESGNSSWTNKSWRVQFLEPRPDLSMLHDWNPHIRLQALSTPAKKMICWTTKAVSSALSMNCAEREMTHSIEILDERVEVIAFTDTGEVAGVGLPGNNTHKIIFGYATPTAFASEETCLLGFERGRSCLYARAFPGYADSAVVLVSSDPTVQQAVRSFGLPVYSPTAWSDWLQGSQPSRMCVKTQLPFASFDALSPIDASNLKSERQVQQVLAVLRQRAHCPHLQKIALPNLTSEYDLASLRSLLFDLKQRPIWITTPARFSERIDATRSNIKLFTEKLETHEAVNIEVNQPLSFLALVMASPNVSSNSILETVRPEGVDGSWQLRRVETQVLTMVFESMESSLRLFTRPSQGNSYLKNTITLMRLHILVCLIVALSIHGLQIVGNWNLESRKLFFPVTFFSVWLICLLWSWYSYDKSQHFQQWRGAVTDGMLTMRGKYFFVDEWPAAWSFAVQKNENQGDLGKALPDGWELTKANLLKKSKSAGGHGNIRPIKPSIEHSFIYDHKPTIYLWDSQAARNSFFRNSSGLRLALFAWRDALLSWDFKYQEIDDQDLGQLAGEAAEGSILIAPDLQFLNLATLAGLEKYISSGGRLVFSEVAEGYQNSDSFRILSQSRDHRLLAGLSQAGFGQSLSRKYSHFSTPIGGDAVVDQYHRVLPGKDFSRWYSAKPFGKGMIYFIGFSPTNRIMRGLAHEMMAQVSGFDLRVVSPRQQLCLASLIIEPWGVPPAQLAARFKQLAKREIPYGLLFDPRSLIDVYPWWKEVIGKNAVIFSIGGNKSDRRLASVMSQDLLRQGETVFAASQSTIDNLGGGPGILVPFTYVGARNQLHDGLFQCQFGLAKPMVVSAKLLAEIIPYLEQEQGQGTRWVSIQEWARIAADASVANRGQFEDVVYRSTAQELFNYRRVEGQRHEHE